MPHASCWGKTGRSTRGVGLWLNPSGGLSSPRGVVSVFETRRKKRVPTGKTIVGIPKHQGCALYCLLSPLTWKLTPRVDASDLRLCFRHDTTTHDSRGSSSSSGPSALLHVCLHFHHSTLFCQQSLVTIKMPAATQIKGENGRVGAEGDHGRHRRETHQPGQQPVTRPGVCACGGVFGEGPSVKRKRESFVS